MLRFRMILVVGFAAASAYAQNSRSAVSVTGNDANPCTVASPCRSFGAAVAQTNAGGEVIALDTAGYGPFNIFKELTVSGAPGVHAALTVTSGLGIYVNAGATDKVLLRNLVFIGAGGAGAIEADAGGELTVIGCTTRGFTGNQIFSAITLIVDHCVVTNGAAGTSFGVVVHNPPGPAVGGTITDSLIDSQFVGIFAGQQATVVATDTTITNNTYGAESYSFSGTSALTADLTLAHCTIAHNSYGLAAFVQNNNHANAYLHANTISYNTTGVFVQGAGVVYTYGNNAFTGNGSEGAALSLIYLH